ncbi:hypothetical protein [Thalassobacillus sp. C254]|uniref:hypothetical protein n=1 Tax=Thalassobacillus sp. C254 TaxID=1225341 RepID=UPI0006D120BC|nr:hypothetical protein [Thalassobacillus sp. C254]
MRGTYIILSLAASLSLLVTACSLNPLTNDIKVKEVDVNIISEDHKMSLYHGQPDTQVTLSKLEYRIYLQEAPNLYLKIDTRLEYSPWSPFTPLFAGAWVTTYLTTKNK